MFSFERIGPTQRILVAFNLASQRSRLERDRLPSCRAIEIENSRIEIAHNEIVLPPYRVLFAALDT